MNNSVNQIMYSSFAVSLLFGQKASCVRCQTSCSSRKEVPTTWRNLPWSHCADTGV